MEESESRRDEEWKTARVEEWKRTRNRENALFESVQLQIASREQNIAYCNVSATRNINKHHFTWMMELNKKQIKQRKQITKIVHFQFICVFIPKIGSQLIRMKKNAHSTIILLV